ncbi:hypothetical protein WKK05_34280 [Nostoc sp. UHCC 0302]|uniref:hypothetical protein n=1 Tax=Nostoc sp. UHCC 0302 TaxID=3134896 RepID=UPI00311CC8B6
MKAHIFLLFALLLLTPPAFAQTPISTPQITATLKPTATSTPSKSPKKPPISKFAEDLETLDKSLTAIAFTLAKAVVAVLSILVLYRLLLLIAYRSSQLIIDNFSNYSGADEELDKVLPGLSQLAREMLVQEMKGVRQRMKEHIKSAGPETYRSRDQLPLPQATPEQRLADLVASLSEFTPDQIDPIVHLLKVIFPPFGTKVTSILQSQGKEHNRLGITFEITNIEGRLSSKLYTIWESDAQNDSSTQILKDRYRKLLKSATRWLALELCRREMLTVIPWNYFGERRNRYQGQVHNFFGALNQASAQTHGSFFGDLAIEDLQQAIVFYPDWYQPYENLADIYSLKEGLYWRRQAILQYEKALERCQDESIKRRIRVGKAITGLVKTDDLAQDKKNEIDNLVQEAKQEIEKVLTGWDETSELNHRFLYNLACWYAIAHRQNAGVEDALLKARRYLVYAFARDSDRIFWDWADQDPELQGICEGITELKFHLLKKFNTVPQFSTLTHKDFAQSIEEVLKTAKWL